MRNNPRKLIIALPAGANQQTIKNLSQFFDTCSRGMMKVILEINNTKLETPYCISHIDDLETKLKTLIPGSSVSIF